MMAMATIRLKLTMMDAKLKVDSPTFSRSCATAVSSTMRRVRGAKLKALHGECGNQQHRAEQQRGNRRIAE